MPQSVQHIKRKFRLSGKDLTRLAQNQYPNSKVNYCFGKQKPIGWYIDDGAFLGKNWVEAKNFLIQLKLVLEGLK